MNSIDELIILSKAEESYIGICSCCSTINFVYKNIAIKFTLEEFEYFKNYFDNLIVDHFVFESRTGKNIFMSSSMPNIVFCFSKNEISGLKDLLNQASVMLEVKKILS